MCRNWRRPRRPPAPSSTCSTSWQTWPRRRSAPRRSASARLTSRPSQAPAPPEPRVPGRSWAVAAAAGVALLGVVTMGYGVLRSARPNPAVADPAAAPARPASPSDSPSPVPSYVLPAPSASPSRPAGAVPASFPHRGPGTFRYAGGTGPVLGRAGTLHRFRVAVESNVTQVDLNEFAAKIDAALGDPRSWIASGAVRFQRVPAGAAYDFTIHLATHDTAGRMCRAGGIATATGYTSCRAPGKVILSLDRWFQSVPYYTDAHVPLDTYR